MSANSVEVFTGGHHFCIDKILCQWKLDIIIDRIVKRLGSTIANISSGCRKDGLSTLETFKKWYLGKCRIAILIPFDLADIEAPKCFQKANPALIIFGVFRFCGFELGKENNRRSVFTFLDAGSERLPLNERSQVLSP
jgi:hypothetical protein